MLLLVQEVPLLETKFVSVAVSFFLDSLVIVYRGYNIFNKYNEN